MRFEDKIVIRRAGIYDQVIFIFLLFNGLQQRFFFDGNFEVGINSGPGESHSFHDRFAAYSIGDGQFAGSALEFSFEIVAARGKSGTGDGGKTYKIFYNIHHIAYLFQLLILITGN